MDFLSHFFLRKFRMILEGKTIYQLHLLAKSSSNTKGRAHEEEDDDWRRSALPWDQKECGVKEKCSKHPSIFFSLISFLPWSENHMKQKQKKKERKKRTKTWNTSSLHGSQWAWASPDNNTAHSSSSVDDDGDKWNIYKRNWARDGVRRQRESRGDEQNTRDYRTLQQ